MRLSFAIVVSLLALACGDDSTTDAGRSDAPAGDGGSSNGCNRLSSPVASPGDPIDGDTYETFASGFFTTYCVRCHSTTRTTPAERNEAPPGRNWDDPDSVRMYLEPMRLWVGVANGMPIILDPDTDPLPTCAERFRLVRWIDAGAP